MRNWPDLAVVELLVAVGERGSVAAAANSVGMAQPNASRSLRRLERRLGMQLLRRSPRGSTLTVEGQAVVGWGSGLLAEAERFASACGALGSDRGHRLAVAASQTVAEYLMPVWLARLRQVAPEIEVALTVVNTEGVISTVLAGGCDLGFIERPSLPRGVGSRIVAQDELFLVVAPGHPWSRRRGGVTLAEVAATSLVVREEGSGTRGVLEEQCAAHQLVMAPPAQCLQSNAAVRIAARAGVAPAVVSGFVVSDLLKEGLLHRVPVADANLRRPLRAIWSGGVPGGRAATLLATATGSRCDTAP